MLEGLEHRRILAPMLNDVWNDCSCSFDVMRGKTQEINKKTFPFSHSMTGRSLARVFLELHVGENNFHITFIASDVNIDLANYLVNSL